MPGIYIMAAITTLLALAIIGGAVLKKADRKDYKYLIAALLIGIPAFWAAFYVLRIPLIEVAKSVVEYESNWFGLISSTFAPLTEELLKLAVVVLPFIYKKITKKNYLFYAFATGLGFGVGEIWFLAPRIAMTDIAIGLPWYAFTGFLVERFLVTFIHGSFLAVTLHFLIKHKQIRGLGYAMLLHWSINIPIFIGIIFNLGEYIIWQIFLSLWVIIFAFIMVGVIAYIKYGTPKIGYFLAGKAKCPTCHKEYERPLFGIELLVKRYEKCPHCQKWHWIGRKQQVK